MSRTSREPPHEPLLVYIDLRALAALTRDALAHGDSLSAALTRAVRRVMAGERSIDGLRGRR